MSDGDGILPPGLRRLLTQSGQLYGHHPLDDYRVDWLASPAEATSALQLALEAEPDEAAVQAVLSEHPILLARTLGGGHGRWIIPKVRLGSQYETDFVLGQRSSRGFEWTLVELESPKHSMTTKGGRQSAELTQAVHQIRQWRSWLAQNLDYARRPPHEDGLGLTGIAPAPEALVLIGRRGNPRNGQSATRNSLYAENRIDVHTFDWLLDLS